MKIIGKAIFLTLLFLVIIIYFTLADEKSAPPDNTSPRPVPAHDVTKIAPAGNTVINTGLIPLLSTSVNPPNHTSDTISSSDEQHIKPVPSTSAMHHGVTTRFPQDVAGNRVIATTEVSNPTTPHGYLATGPGNLATATTPLATRETSLATTKKITCSDPNGWNLLGTEWGCCGNYKECCIYASLVCYIHDAMCRCCDVGDNFCGPKCKPESTCKNKQEDTDDTPVVEPNTPTLSTPLIESQTSFFTDVTTRVDAINDRRHSIIEASFNADDNDFQSKHRLNNENLSSNQDKGKETNNDTDSIEHSGETEFVAEL